MGNLVSSATFQPPRAQSETSFVATDFVRTSAGNSIPVYYQEAAAPDRPVILACHGNADDVDGFVSIVGIGLLNQLADDGVGLYVFEYPGYTGTTGDARQRTVYAAALSAYDDLVEKRGVDARRIIVYGKSLGSAVATYIVAQRASARTLVLVSPLMSVFRVALGNLGVTLPGDIMTTIDYIGRIGATTSVSIVHGAADEVIAPVHAQRLYEAAVAVSPNNTHDILWIARGKHNFELTELPAVGSDSTRVLSADFEQLTAHIHTVVIPSMPPVV